MLRGLAREQRHWGGFADVFGRKVAPTRIHYLDFPGVGTENHRPSPLSVDSMVADLRRRWLELTERYDGPWSLLGISLGGMACMHWCATYPVDFEHLVVVNSSTRDLSALHRRLNPKVMPKMVRAIFESDPLARERRVLDFTSRLCSNRDEVASRAAQLASERPVKRRTVIKQLVAAATFETPPRIEVPTLVLASARDDLADPMCAVKLARHFDAPLRIHPEAGHDLSLDAPDWISRQVALWLDKG